MSKYVRQENGDYHCAACGSVIMAIAQRRPVWEFASACAGSGRTETVQVPYCPTCEPEPSPNGPPIGA